MSSVYIFTRFDRKLGKYVVRLSNSQRYLVVGLVGSGLPLTVTIRVSMVSTMVSVRVSVN